MEVLSNMSGVTLPISNSMRQSGSMTAPVDSLAEYPCTLEICGVRILPPQMYFKDAYDGKSYQQDLVIMNCGDKQVTVRVGRPTSMKFTLKPVVRVLPVGLRITRKIHFTYSSATSLLQAHVPIHVNEYTVNYPLLVSLCYASVTVSPKLLDFGNIDIGVSSGIKSVIISNTGTKNSQFAIDLGRNELELVVEPMRGNLQPKESRKIKLELFAMKPGIFNSEFWIKTEPQPRRVKLFGQFIKPKLMMEFPTTSNFVFLLYPRMYYGTSCSKVLVIKNFSSIPSMFYVLAEVHEKLVNVVEAQQKLVNFRQFTVTPTEGRIFDGSEMTIRVTFSPSKHYDKSYYICMYKIVKIECRDFPPGLNIEFFSKKCCSTIATDLDPVGLESCEEMAYAIESEHAARDQLELYVYGEVERPNIFIRPDSICLTNLEIGEIHAREIYFKNLSNYLPITIKTNSVVCVEFTPQIVTLDPNESIEILMRIRPSKLGEVQNQIKLELLDPRTNNVQVGLKYLEISYNTVLNPVSKEPKFSMGLVPLYTHEVGFLTDDVRYNTTVKMPRMAIVDKKWHKFNKHNGAFVAFPNDRPKAIRPWKELTPCTTIFASIPRSIETTKTPFEFSKLEKRKKEQLAKYYIDFIRSIKHTTAKLPRIRKKPDYNLTDTRRLLLEDERMISFIERQPVEMIENFFCPMTPKEIYNVTIRPKFVYLGKLALQSTAKGSFMIENKNKFKLMVTMLNLSRTLRAVDDHTIVPPDASKNIYFDYTPEAGGKQHVPIMILVNFTHVFDVTVLARIVPKTTHCLNDEIVIDPKNNFAIIEMANPMLSPIDFAVESCFEELCSKLAQGTIPPKRKICNSITFVPMVETSDESKEIYVSSESGEKHLIKIIYDSKKPQVLMSTEILNFEDTPLNMPTSKQLVLRNMSNEHVVFRVDESTIPKEITLSMVQTIMLPKSDIHINVTLCIKEVVKFNFSIYFFLQDIKNTVEITGSTIYPSISFSPELIKLRKVVTGSLTTSKIKIKNNSPSKVIVTFPLEDYLEFKIKNDFEIIINKIELGINETVELFLDFMPIEPMAYCIILPYVVNNILGPPELNNISSLDPAAYIETKTNSPRKSAIQIPNKMNTLKLLCSAGAAWLKFNTLSIKFLNYNGQGKMFEITNMTEDIKTVYLDVVSLKHFSVTPEEDIELQMGFYRMELEPQACARFEVMFVPETHGVFSLKLPIMVDEYCDGNTIFNYLSLDGVYPTPYIITNPRVLHFPAIPPASRHKLQVEVHLFTHQKMQCDEKVDVEAFDESISVVWNEKEKVSEFDREVEVFVEFRPNGEEMFLDSKIVISCACYTSAEVYLKGKSSFSIFKCISLFEPPKCFQDFSAITTFPYFPDDSNDSVYANQMRGILQNLEKWVYEQGFFYRTYYTIPDTISRFPQEIEPPTKDKQKRQDKKKKPQAVLPLIQLLVNLVNKSIFDEINCGLRPFEDDIHQTLYLYATYKNTLAFLKSQTIFVPRIRPEHLLQYKQFEIYTTKIQQEEDSKQTTILDESQFYAFSKRCWLDLILCTYKVFVFDRTVDRYIKPKETETRCESDDIFRDEFESYLKKKEIHFKQKPLEAKLLYWYEFHYNNQRRNIWSDESVDKSIECFDDLRDSIVLAAATAAYCPYAADHIKDMYPMPENEAQLVHNSCQLIQTWQNLGISFSVHPSSILKDNKLFHCMIATYLYGILPTYYPKQVIDIRCPLASTGTCKISIKNTDDSPIGYITKLYGEHDLFEVEDSFVIPPKKQTDLVVSYLSKNIQRTEAVLLINGEAIGQKYGKSMAVTLRGLSNLSACEEISLQGTVFKSANRKVTIQSPYATAYKANIIISYNSNTPDSKEDFTTMNQVRKLNVPRQISILSDEIEFDETGVGVLDIQMCYLCLGQFPYTICFTDEDQGDFCVKILVKIKPNKTNVKTIKVQLNETFKKKKCTCKKEVKFSCPRTFQVPISSIDEMLLEAVDPMMHIWLNPEHASHWNEIISDQILAFRFLKHYIGKFPKHYIQFWETFTDYSTYKSDSNKKKNFSIPESFVIRNTATQSTIMLPVHWNTPGYPSNDTLTLVNENGKDIRYYKMEFTPPTNYGSVLEGEGGE